MKLANPDILTINAGSSSIKFALYQTGERLEQRLQGSVDRIGLPGTKLTFCDSAGKKKGSLVLETSDTRSVSNSLIDWLEDQIDFSSIKGCGFCFQPFCIFTECLRLDGAIHSLIYNSSPARPSIASTTMICFVG